MEKEDAHNEVEYALLDEQAHVPIGLPLLCHAVHLKRLPRELEDGEHAHRCTICDLQNGDLIRPDGGRLHQAK